MTEQRLEGPEGGLVIVTGGGRGIGAAVSIAAAALGHPVLVNYAGDEASADALARRIADQGGRAQAVRADVGTEEGVLRLFAAADGMGVPLAGLVNNAGISGGFARLDELEGEALRRVLAVNVAGSFLCAREAVRRMSTRHGGRGGTIVNVSSIAAKLGSAGEWIHYAASKGAIDTLTVGLAREVAGEGIRVNAVAPGLVATDLHAAAGAPDRLERLAPGIPMGRAGTAEEVAASVLWLMSASASYVTGAVLPVGGGR
ncbi:MAG: SDR family oxidoreductase [Acetobacteraceae bacterium]|nr:SDR family oxidoreductase [Acetobacteraceae bacterium]